MDKTSKDDNYRKGWRDGFLDREKLLLESPELKNKDNKFLDVLFWMSIGGIITRVLIALLG